MNEQTLEYNGYLAKVVESEIGGLKGTVTNFDNDYHFMSFRAKNLEGMQKEFKAMIDWYLETCQRDGIEPSKPKILSVHTSLNYEMNNEKPRISSNKETLAHLTI